jgi:hypothetical protein
MDSFCKSMDSFCKSMDSFCFMIDKSDYIDLQIRICESDIQFVDSICRLIFKRFDLFSQTIQQILTIPDKSLAHRRTFNKPKSIQILGLGYCFQKIHFLDSFCPTVLKRLVLSIQFVDLFLKDLFRGFIL